MTTAFARLPRCDDACTAAVMHPEHHDRLLRVDVDQEVQLELFELAVTWHELDYSDSPVLGPSDWLRFAAAHRWTSPSRAERVFSLAVDIAGRRAAGPAPDGELARVIELVRA